MVWGLGFGTSESERVHLLISYPVLWDLGFSFQRLEGGCLQKNLQCSGVRSSGLGFRAYLSEVRLLSPMWYYLEAHGTQ